MDERKLSAELAEKSRAELAALKTESEATISELRSDCEKKVQDLEKRLEVALGTNVIPHTYMQSVPHNVI